MRLRVNGWKTLKSRYRSPYGEIDIIMQKPDRLLFVEVKFTNKTGDNAIETVVPQFRQRRRIYDTAKHFLIEHPSMAQFEMRFVIAIVQAYGRIEFIDDLFFDMI